MSEKNTERVPGWQSVITDEHQQFAFMSITQYLTGHTQQMLLLDRWTDVEFEDCESHLIFSFRTDDTELSEMLRNESSWVFGIGGVVDIEDGWFEIYPHSVNAETRAWIAQKYGVRSGPDRYI